MFWPRLTATMALNYTASHSMNVMRSAETIMDTLPICSVRKISYSTFTIVDIDTTGRTRIIEHGNPSFVVLRPDGEVPVQRKRERLEKWEDRFITNTTFKASIEDRIVFFSDGVSQAGTGEAETPFGWGEENVADFARARVKKYPGLSASELVKNIMDKALKYDGGAAKDDITCAVIYFREPRRLLVVTGPPYSNDSDHEFAEIVKGFNGEKVVCGGTTASIIGRELKIDVAVDLDEEIDPNIPPPRPHGWNRSCHRRHHHPGRGGAHSRKQFAYQAISVECRARIGGDVIGKRHRAVCHRHAG